MMPEGAEYLGIDADLSECSMDDAVYKILPKIGKPTQFTLRVDDRTFYQARRLAHNSFYPAAVIVDDEPYEGFGEWSLTGEGSDGSCCVWSPGA